MVASCVGLRDGAEEGRDKTGAEEGGGGGGIGSPRRRRGARREVITGERSSWREEGVLPQPDVEEVEEVEEEAEEGAGVERTSVRRLRKAFICAKGSESRLCSVSLYLRNGKKHSSVLLMRSRRENNQTHALSKVCSTPSFLSLADLPSLLAYQP